MTLSESPMSGDFFLDSPVPPKLDLTGARSQFYRSPRTPSATSSLCRSVTSSALAGSRKRPRYGYNDLDSHQTFGGFDDRISWGEDQSTQFNDPTSPAPLVNTDYRLAGGGLESHKLSLATATTALEYDDNGAELDYRPSRYSTFPMTITSERNKRKRERPPSSGNDTEQADGPSSPSSSGWGRAMINLVGGVAGKVWDFCWSGAFRGFYAGGGRGYGMDASAANAFTTPSLDQSAWEKLNQTSDLFDNKHVKPNDNLVNGWQQADNDWVLVKNEKDFVETNSSSVFGKVPRRTGVMRHVGSRRPAIRAVPKRPSLTPIKPSSISHQASFTPSTNSQTANNPSKTSKESPLAIEAQRYAAKVRRREREEDASIRRLNQQLKAMIREGKEALGTKIEIDDSMDVDEFE
ncbi:hypothetical protein PRK78_005082 [Emydomyces testavorans]|uniref:Uncharacterized protein n=1 Tax=Emydomyces testavorans TaxID=2070801 RepID=A0AAF0IK68_9EURO|nr:hypothetical protein PRK78_005082 [Emydomyces testavorans]